MKRDAALWKQTLLGVAAVLLNAALLAQAVGVPSTRLARALSVPYADGDRCTLPGQCASGFCAQGVCCNVACSGTGQTCAAPGSEGTCIRQAQSPALSLPFQWVAAGVVALISAWRLRRRLR